MSRHSTSGGGATALAVALLLLAPLGGAVLAVTPGGTLFRDGPPARVSGGFGEDSCFACHWGGEENDGVGRLALTGAPDRYEPGREYDLEVTLVRRGMEVAGFQLASRFAADTAQAGEFQVPGDEEGRVSILQERGVHFVHHTLGGIRLAAPDTARWRVRWRAPVDPGRGVVLFHLSAVAGDDDESQMGDFAYTVELSTRDH